GGAVPVADPALEAHALAGTDLPDFLSLTLVAAPSGRHHEDLDAVVAVPVRACPGFEAHVVQFEGSLLLGGRHQSDESRAAEGVGIRGRKGELYGTVHRDSWSDRGLGRYMSECGGKLRPFRGRRNGRG